MNNYNDKNNRLIKIKTKFITLITAAVLGITGYSVVKQINNNKQSEDDLLPSPEPTIESTLTDEPISNTPIPTEIPTPVITPIPNVINRGDSIKSKADVNMRLKDSTNSFKIGLMYKDSIVDRILSINGFDLVKYYNQLAFVSSEYTDSNVEDYNNDYYYVEEYNDIVHTTTEVNFRLGPSTKEDKIQLLEKNKELEVFAKTTSYSDPNDIWYIARYKDKIGFIKAQYTESLKEIIQKMDPTITNVEIKKIGYAKNYTNLYDYQGNYIKSIDEYQTFKIFEDKGNCYLVEYDNKMGLVSKNDVRTYDGTFVIVDLSDQKVYLYCNTDEVFESVCTTGADLTPTNTGDFSVYERTNSRYFSDEAEARYMWANFDHGNGLHDAPWENESKFGSNKFRKNHGSKGCVRLPDEAALFLMDYVKIGTKVLVKE